MALKQFGVFISVQRLHICSASSYLFGIFISVRHLHISEIKSNHSLVEVLKTSPAGLHPASRPLVQGCTRPYSNQLSGFQENIKKTKINISFFFYILSLISDCLN